MKKMCEKCGNEISNDDKFCRTCGAKVEKKQINLDEKTELNDSKKKVKTDNNHKFKEKLKSNKNIIFIIGILIICLCILFACFTLKSKNSVIYGDHKNVSITETNTISEAIDKVYDAVVYVESSRNGRALSSGSGFIYKKDNEYGYIMTNYHVVENSDSVTITMMSGDWRGCLF